MPDDARVSRPVGASMLLTLPNAVTFARLCAVPATMWLILRHDLHAAFAVFVAAGLSDAVDGWLARRRGGGNAVGAVLDPVADKALLVSLYVTLAAIGVLPDALAILVVFRDVVIVGGVLVLAVLGHAVRIRPFLISKVNTAVQIVLVGVALLLDGFGLHAPMLMTALVWTVAATTFASGAAYVWWAARRPVPEAG
jgi:cardiolipin synthase